MGKIRDQLQNLQSIDINQVSKFDKFFFLYLLVFVCLLVFMGLFYMKPLWTDDMMTNIYIYRMPLTLVLTAIFLRLHVINILSIWFRNFINRIFGFINPISLWFFFQFGLLITFLNISEIIWLARSMTNTIYLSNGYYVILGWIILWLIFQSIKLIKFSKETDNQSQILNINTKKKHNNSESESFKNLFDD